MDSNIVLLAMKAKDRYLLKQQKLQNTINKELKMRRKASKVI
jgi:hypothetical protein